MARNPVSRSFLVAAFLACFVCQLSGSAQAGWRHEMRVNVDGTGKQASRGRDCPWSIAVDSNDRVHVVWEDRRTGMPLRIFYRGKDPDPTWYRWDTSDYEISMIDSLLFFGHPSVMPMASGQLFSVYVEEKVIGGELFGSWMSNHPGESVRSEIVSHAGGSRLTFSSAGWQTTIAAQGNRAITFWPYNDDPGSGNLPIYYRIYEQGSAVTPERALVHPEFGLSYVGINLSATPGSSGEIYLICRLSTDGFPLGHIWLFTFDIQSGDLIAHQDLTPWESRLCQFPYLAAAQSTDGRDSLFAVYQVGADSAVVAFIHNINGQWSAPVMLAPPGATASSPCLTKNGKYVDIVYQSPAKGPLADIFHQRYYIADGTFSEPFQISHSDHFSKLPVVVSDSYGNLHLIYITNRENPDGVGDEEVYYCIYDAPPATPKNFSVEDSLALLTWSPNREPDVSHYEVEIPEDGTLFEVDSPVFDFGGLTATSALVRAVDLIGQKSSAAMVDLPLQSPGAPDFPLLPAQAAVGQNFPNPFNAGTVIPVYLADPSYPGYLEILDITGRMVYFRLITEPGTSEIVWDGTALGGERVSSGIYFYRLKVVHAYTGIRRMTLIR